jgi:DNA polymerase-3 subunit delta'
MRFAKVIGSATIKERLVSAAQSGHVPHALLFHGDPGSAAFSLAKALGAYLLCENQQAGRDSCGQCAACHKYDKGIHPDLHFIYPVPGAAESDQGEPEMPFLPEWRNLWQTHHFPELNGWAEAVQSTGKAFLISKNESRVINKAASLKAFEGRYKLIFLWLPEMMNPTAGNRLLKLLEEPPAQTLFILISEEPDKVMATILSRTQIIHVQPFNSVEIQSYLEGEHQLSTSEAVLIAGRSEGSILKALAWLNSEGTDTVNFALQWFRDSRDLNAAGLSERSDAFAKLNKQDQKAVIQQAFQLVRESMVYRFATEELLRLPEERKEIIRRLSTKLSLERCEALLKILNDTGYHLERNANSRLTFFDTSLLLHEQLQ